MITVEELIIQSLYHRLTFVNVRRTPASSTEPGQPPGDSSATQAAGTDLDSGQGTESDDMEGLGEFNLTLNKAYV